MAFREQEKQQADTQKANDKIQRQLAKEKKEKELKQRRVDREHARVQREKIRKPKRPKKKKINCSVRLFSNFAMSLRLIKRIVGTIVRDRRRLKRWLLRM